MADMGPNRAITKSRFVVVVIVWGPSMAVIESQIKVIATWFETKHGHLWWPTRGCDDSAETKHDRLWRPIQGCDYMIQVHVESELDGGRYGRGSGWSEDVTPRLLCQLFRSRRFIFQWHLGHREAARLSRYDAFNAHVARSSIIRALNVSSRSDRSRWFKFLNKSPIPATDLISKPPAVDFY